MDGRAIKDFQNLPVWQRAQCAGGEHRGMYFFILDSGSWILDTEQLGEGLC